MDDFPMDITDDPTLQRTYEVTCPQCHTPGGAYIRAHDGAKESTLGLIWMCINADCAMDSTGISGPPHRWREEKSKKTQH